MNTVNAGLDGVVVGTTAISLVQGDSGQLSYRGIAIQELVQRPFCQVIWHLLFGTPADASEEQRLAHYLAEHRQLTAAERATLSAMPEALHPMQMLQAMVPVLELREDATIELPTDQLDARLGLQIAARLPTLIAAWYRRQTAQSWPVSSHSIEPQRFFLKSLRGSDPEPAEVAALDCAQILQLEHSFNAGTFAGRVALSTGASLAASIAASLGTLSGPLHGGADEAALTMALEVGSAANAEHWLARHLSAGGRVMGIGHREYRTLDPRAALLKPMARELCQCDPKQARLFATLEQIEQVCGQRLSKPGRALHANVEFYKGAVFHALGIPSTYFTALFAMARVYGYIAHALEYRPGSRLIRPAAEYVGPRP